MRTLVLVLITGLFFMSCNQTDKLSKATTDCKTQKETSQPIVNTKNNTMEKIVKSDEEWKSELTEMEYHVLRNKGTERAGTGDLLNNKGTGTYICRGCGLELFDSETKYESGSGWPSFYAPVNETNVGENTDNSHGMKRVEVVCARCDGHLGHVFPDGPRPTGMRYCINAVSLDFTSKEEK